MDKLREGVDAYLAGDHSVAINLLTQYIDENGEFQGQAYYHLGLIYSDSQQLAISGEYLSKAISLEPDKATYHYKIGIVYSRLMALDKAIEHLKRSIQLNPEHQRSRFILGTVYFQRGLMQEALDTFTALIERSPDFADAYYNRSLCYYHIGDEKLYEQDILKALEINPTYNVARLSLARHYLSCNKQKKAVENFEIIYNNGFRDYVFIKSYIEALLMIGDKITAKDVAVEALHMYPNNIDIEVLIKRCG